MQQTIIDVGKQLIHTTIGNQDHSQLYNKSTMPKIMGDASKWQSMITTNVELLAANWKAYQSLGHDIQVSLSFWEFCQLTDMHKSIGIHQNYVGLMRWIGAKDKKVVEGAMAIKEIVEHTPIDEVSGDIFTLGEVPSIVEVSIDEASRSVTESQDSIHL